MTGAETAIERLAIKAERIAAARAETLARQRRNPAKQADILRPLARHERRKEG